ncbi:hypothetical protein RU09_06085 [Microbacterium sp. MEJ108Y]|uniref:hypothetical protein n=1 Tax=Microbacterium sp. MEJ108Y TaxID=1587523 RepID=UPI0005AC23AE|nr:hypothetical protein [Microbacterium sp. MEJ108Y]KIP93380.1 hypothetical protein RU09_06085 [Microbacterium sp. MEJ108Y]
MATPRKTTAPVLEYDFDSWSEEAEEKAIAAAVPDVKYIIVEKRFIGRLADGTIVEAPLSLSLDEVDEMQAEHATPVDQFKSILKKVGGEKIASEFSSRDMVEGAILAEKYFRVLQRVQQAAFPE